MFFMQIVPFYKMTQKTSYTILKMYDFTIIMTYINLFYSFLWFLSLFVFVRYVRVNVLLNVRFYFYEFLSNITHGSACRTAYAQASIVFPEMC